MRLPVRSRACNLGAGLVVGASLLGACATEVPQERAVAPASTTTPSSTTTQTTTTTQANAALPGVQALRTCLRGTTTVVVRRRTVLVVETAAGTGHRRSSPVDLAGLAAQVERAERTVLTHWPDPPSGSDSPGRVAVVGLPADDASAARCVGTTARALAGTAAVADGPLVEGSPAAADRVVLVPTAWQELSRVGQQVVLAHELTHLALRAQPCHRLPRWLSEGVADDIAYADSGLSEHDAAAGLLRTAPADAAARRWPAELPGDAAFEEGAGAARDVAYDSARLAVATLREDSSPAQVREVVTRTGRRTARGESEARAVDAALRETVGYGTEELTRRWQARVERLRRAG